MIFVVFAHKQLQLVVCVALDPPRVSEDLLGLRIDRHRGCSSHEELPHLVVHNDQHHVGHPHKPARERHRPCSQHIVQKGSVEKETRKDQLEEQCRVHSAIRHPLVDNGEHSRFADEKVRHLDDDDHHQVRRLRIVQRLLLHHA